MYTALTGVIPPPDDDDDDDGGGGGGGGGGDDVVLPPTVKKTVVALPPVYPVKEPKQITVASNSLNNDLFEEVGSARSPAGVLEEAEENTTPETMNNSRSQGMNLHDLGQQLIEIEPALKRRLNLGI